MKNNVTTGNMSERRRGCRLSEIMLGDLRENIISRIDPANKEPDTVRYKSLPANMEWDMVRYKSLQLTVRNKVVMLKCESELYQNASSRHHSLFLTLFSWKMEGKKQWQRQEEWMLVLSLHLSHRRVKYVWCTHFIVTSDDNDSDASVTAGLDGILDFLTWWVQHADHTNKGHVCLQEEIKQLWHIENVPNKPFQQTKSYVFLQTEIEESYDTSRNISHTKIIFVYKQKLHRVMTHLEFTI